jgi:hypothetical protein
VTAIPPVEAMSSDILFALALADNTPDAVWCVAVGELNARMDENRL